VQAPRLSVLGDHGNNKLGTMSTPSAAMEQQRKIPSRERRQQKRSGDRGGKEKAVSKAAANSVINSVKRPSVSLSTPPPRSQQRGGQDGAFLLNFRAPERQRDSGTRPLPIRRRGPVVQFNKDRFFGANYRFVVARDQSEDYGVHLAFPDKSVDWSLIREVHVSEVGCYNCPICLEPPIAARLTQCGHVYCWPCLKRLLHVAAKHYAPCPICTNIVTSSRGMLKPAVVHAHDPVKVFVCAHVKVFVQGVCGVGARVVGVCVHQCVNRNCGASTNPCAFLLSIHRPAVKALRGPGQWTLECL